MRRRSRTICLSLAFISIFLHLLLALVSLSTYQQPCDTPLPPRTQFRRDVARTNYTSVGIRSPAEPRNDAMKRDSSYEEGKNETKGHVLTLSDRGLPVKGSKNNSVNMAGSGGRYGSSRAKTLESDLLKLEALFDHPLYKILSPPVPQDDWLLKVKPKVKASEKSSQMWSVYKLSMFKSG